MSRFPVVSAASEGCLVTYGYGVFLHVGKGYPSDRGLLPGVR
jgi:hypothetical protein